jgi:hypothetical protein
MATVHFLLVYNRSEQRLTDHQAYSNSDEAVSAYEDMESAHRGDDNMEIVLVGADSIETVMLTHGNYFEGVQNASPYLADV